MSLPWTGQQREWLRVLGHSVLALTGDEDGPDVDSRVDIGPVHEPPPTARVSASTPPPRAVEEVRSTPPAPASGPAVSGPMGDRLYRALLRATAQRTSCEGEAMLQAMAFDLDALRAEPGHKRRLWQQLRAARMAARA